MSWVSRYSFLLSLTESKILHCVRHSKEVILKNGLNFKKLIMISAISWFFGWRLYLNSFDLSFSFLSFSLELFECEDSNSLTYWMACSEVMKLKSWSVWIPKSFKITFTWSFLLITCNFLSSFLSFCSLSSLPHGERGKHEFP